jgi:hypothetical protein
MADTMRPRKEDDSKKDRSDKSDRNDKKRVSKRDPLAPAFRDARVREKESRTADTGDPSIS